MSTQRFGHGQVTRHFAYRHEEKVPTDPTIIMEHGVRDTSGKLGGKMKLRWAFLGPFPVTASSVLLTLQPMDSSESWVLDLRHGMARASITQLGSTTLLTAH